jgi:hypothetical protein
LLFNQESVENAFLENLNLNHNTIISTMDSNIQMFTITHGNNDSLVGESIALPIGLASDTEFLVPVTDVSESDGCRTPEKRWCPKRRRITRTSRIRTEGDDTTRDTDNNTVHGEKYKASVEEEKSESLLRTRSLYYQMTPQKVKYLRSKKRRR